MSGIAKNIADLSPEKRRLLELLAKKQGVDLAKSLIVPRARPAGNARLSFAQQRLWFLDQLEPGSPVYNIPLAVRLSGTLDIARLRAALHAIVARHESLRTHFATINEQPLQIITPPEQSTPLDLPVIDLSHLPANTRQAEAERLAAEEARRPFDLAHGPLLRICLLRLEPGEHIALLTMHHIISDGWSMGVLIGEIAGFYGAPADTQLPALPIQYADYAEWQRDWLQGAELERQISYWKQTLAGAPASLDLPTDRPRPALVSPRGDQRLRKLPAHLTPALHELGQREGATPFMLLLAAFQTLLYRYSGQEDFCLGTPIAGRGRRETEPLIGFFVNTLVLRGDLAGDPSFRELLRRTREAALGAFAHQDLPFEMLVEAIQPERDLSRTPLFQVLFILQNTPASTRRLPDLTLSQVDTHSGTSPFDLTLSLVQQADGLLAALEYNSDLFDATSIERMLDHFETLLASIVAQPDLPISRLPLLPATEHHLIEQWAGVLTDAPPAALIHHAFEGHAARTPSACAVVCGNQSLSFAQLNQQSNQLAHYLRSLGVGPEVVVAVCLERSIDVVVALLGILKAGGAYLPLDPNSPAERLQFMLHDAGPAVVLTDQAIADFRLQIADWDGQICNLQSAINNLQLMSNPTGGASANNLAYIIYTSGSTGQPKGVMIEHQAIANHCRTLAHQYALSSQDVVLQFSSLTFDASLDQLMTALSLGARLVLRGPELWAPADLTQAIVAHGITWIDLPTAYWHQLAQEWLAAPAQVPLGTLRLVTPGGEAMRADLTQQWLASPLRALRLANTYGPTEATITATVYTAQSGEAALGYVPIGRPFSNRLAYILDRHMQPVPIGVPGELYLGGEGLARGYLNRPELTAERFVEVGVRGQGSGVGSHVALSHIPAPRSLIPDPHPPRLYKTGDLARYRADGVIEFLSRNDGQVKIRGFRVELGEIEAALAQHPAVREAVVLAREDVPGDKRLVAYVVAGVRDQGSGIRNGDAAADLTPDPRSLIPDLRAYLKTRLPDYMLPAAYVPLEALPLTPNGKVNRRALPAPQPEVGTPADDFRAPATTSEVALAALWAELLGLAQVGADHNFFELGGHSLLATQLISRIRSTFNIELPLRAIFETTTLAELAVRIDSASRTGQAPPIVPLPPDAPLQLSYGQQRLWFLDQLEPGSPLYNMPDAVRLIGPLDQRALERGLNEIIRRHQVLRSTFATIDGRPHLAIAAELQIELPLTDLRHLPVAEREARAQQLVAEMAQSAFDLARGPLIRALLVQLADDEHIVLLTLHHIISDGWSSTLLTRELALLYDAFANQRRSPLPELPIQYADYAAWQRNWLQGETLSSQLAYWQAALAGETGGPPVLRLPTDRPRPAVQTYRGAHYTFELPAELNRAVQELSQRAGTTTFMTLLATFQTLLYRYTGQDDLTVGTPIAGRTSRETEALIGFFINTLVLRAHFADTPSFLQLLHQVRETALDAYAHQDVPFEMVVDALQPERDLSHTPLFQVMFILQNAGQRSAQALPQSGLTLHPLASETGVSNFELTLSLEEGPAGLRGAVEYNTDLFDQATIVRMVGHFARLLAAAHANPAMPVDQLPLLDAAERQQLLYDWNATATAEPTTGRLAELFEAQAQRKPQAVAAIYAGEHLTYGELDARANQLAHYLQHLGVGAGSIVGLCLERSLHLPVALLGILKAGAGYLPLDPAYPHERLQFMIDDARPFVIVTDGQSAVSRQPSADSRADGMPQMYLIPDTRYPIPTVVDLHNWQPISVFPTSNPTSSTTPASLAYVIYTSGSTGTPKGVLVPQGAVVNHNRFVVDAFQLTPADRVLQFATINFDTAVEEIFPTWAAGATLVLRPAGPLLGAAELLELIEAEGLTVLDLPTAYWHAWVAELERSGTQLPPSLRLVVVGGEAATAEHLATWRRVAPGVRWLNTYGPTEATVIASLYEPPPDLPADASIPIGRPIANTQLYVLDKHLQPAPVGIPGELYIGGAGVALGYLNRPALTAERFVTIGGTMDDGRWTVNHAPQPSSVFRLPSPHLYKTGDLARWRADGMVEFLGRADDQVKIRGFRIELGEIETALAQHPMVREAVVLAREDQPGVKRLVAYVVAGVRDQGSGIRNGDAAADLIPDPRSPIPDLRAFLKTRLPEYMQPAAFVVLEALPLTANGKVNRRALPAPAPAAAPEGAATSAATTAAERTLAEVWQQVLGVAQVGIHDNFFELGGDSIMSIQVIARANQAGLHLTPRQLFEAPTIAGLAALAGNGQAIQAEQGIVTGPVTLTPIQHWFFSQQLPAAHHWNQSLLLAVHQPLEPAALETAVAALLAHHDALRLRFVNTSTGWQAHIAGIDALAPVQTQYVASLRDMPEGEQSAAITTITGELQASLNLEHGPLLRVAYFDLGAEHAGRLFVAVHHLAIDGVSWRILLEDLQTAYSQASAGHTPQLPPKTTAFPYWSARLAEYARSATLRAELATWQALAGGAVAPLPLDTPGGNNHEGSTEAVVVTLDAAETDALLHEVPAVYRTEINDLLLSALVQAFERWTGEPNLLVEMEGHGREDLFDDVSLARTVGWFTTTFPLRLDIGAANGPGEVIKTVKQQLRQVPQHGIGYGLLRYLGDEDAVATLSALPVPVVSFNYLGQFDQALPEGTPFGPAREIPGPDRDPRGQRAALIDVTGSIVAGCLRVDISYSRELHDQQTIDWLAGDFINALRDLIAHCQSPEAGGYTPSDFGLAGLDQAQLDKLVSRFNK